MTKEGNEEIIQISWKCEGPMESMYMLLLCTKLQDVDALCLKALLGLLVYKNLAI